MSKGKELSSRFLSNNPRFNYLPDGDRYILAQEESQFRFNIIGVGINGQEHLQVTMAEGRATIHGIYDPNPGSVAQAKQLFQRFATDRELVIYDSLEDACNDTEVDGLIICTPNYTHIDVVKVAIQSGKHILLEKPMATTLTDAFEIQQIAESYGSVFQIGLQYRYKAVYREAIYEALHRQVIGDIKTITLLDHRMPFLDKVNQWNKFSKYSGGTLVEKCCHYFDIFNLFAQSRPTKVYASASMAVNFINFEYESEKSDIVDSGFVIVEYENGIRANFNLCMFAPGKNEELTLCGDSGRIRTAENYNALRDSGPQTYMEIMRGEMHPSRIVTPAYPRYVTESGHHGATFYEHVNFIDNILGKETETATAMEGFWSVVVGLAAEESAKRGMPVMINDLLTEAGLDL